MHPLLMMLAFVAVVVGCIDASRKMDVAMIYGMRSRMSVASFVGSNQGKEVLLRHLGRVEGTVLA